MQEITVKTRVSGDLQLNMRFQTPTKEQEDDFGSFYDQTIHLEIPITKVRKMAETQGETGVREAAND